MCFDRWFTSPELVTCNFADLEIHTCDLTVSQKMEEFAQSEAGTCVRFHLLLIAIFDQIIEPLECFQYIINNLLIIVK